MRMGGERGKNTSRHFPFCTFIFFKKNPSFYELEPEFFLFPSSECTLGTDLLGGARHPSAQGKGGRT